MTDRVEKRVRLSEEVRVLIQEFKLNIVSGKIINAGSVGSIVWRFKLLHYLQKHNPRLKMEDLLNWIKLHYWITDRKPKSLYFTMLTAAGEPMDIDEDEKPGYYIRPPAATTSSPDKPEPAFSVNSLDSVDAIPETVTLPLATSISFSGPGIPPNLYYISEGLRPPGTEISHTISIPIPEIFWDSLSKKASSPSTEAPEPLAEDSSIIDANSLPAGGNASTVSNESPNGPNLLIDADNKVEGNVDVSPTESNASSLKILLNNGLSPNSDHNELSPNRDHNGLSPNSDLNAAKVKTDQFPAEGNASKLTNGTNHRQSQVSDVDSKCQIPPYTYASPTWSSAPSVKNGPIMSQVIGGTSFQPLARNIRTRGPAPRRELFIRELDTNPYQDIYHRLVPIIQTCAKWPKLQCCLTPLNYVKEQIMKCMRGAPPGPTVVKQNEPSPMGERQPGNNADTNVTCDHSDSDTDEIEVIDLD